MSDRTRDGLHGAGAARRIRMRATRPRLESLEGRALLATLAPIANVSAPVTLGYQLPLNGDSAGPQTFTVSSDNPSIKATVAQGKFLTVGVSHASSGASDPAFTGSLTFQLFDDLTPLTTSRIEQLVQEGFYTSPTTATSPILPTKNFHRVASGFPDANGFIVQGGSQTGTGSGSFTAPGFPFSDEFNQQLAFTGSGQLAMANAGDDTNDTQFFITTASPRSLDFNHTIFGQLVSGQETLQRMTQVTRDANDTPKSPILFTSTTLSTSNPNGVVHLDLTGATAGQTANVSVTARDAAGGTVTRTFQVTAAANNDASGNPIVERPFLAPVQNQVVGQNQTAVFQIRGVAPTPGDQLTYGVGGSINSSGTTVFAPIPTTSGTASVDQNGIVTVTPAAGFTGVINLVVGVRDQQVRTGATTLESAANYDTQKITLTVTNGAIVNLKPIAVSAFAAAQNGQPNVIQLQGNTANPQSTTQTLRYTLLSGPAHGTISNFNASDGTFSYTPAADFFGNDTVQFKVTDVGAPGPSLDSDVATETLVVGGGATNAVRLIGNVLVVTPPPRATLADKGTNHVFVTQAADGTIFVAVNGVVDAEQPNASDLDRIVVYGTKNSDDVRVDRSVTVPTTLDGGHGGSNVLVAGVASSTQFGWFGTANVLKGGPSNDRLTGKAGKVKFLPSGGRDLLYAGDANLGHRKRTAIFPNKTFGAKPHPPTGTFYRFIGNKLVKIKSV